MAGVLLTDALTVGLFTPIGRKKDEHQGIGAIDRGIGCPHGALNWSIR